MQDVLNPAAPMECVVPSDVVDASVDSDSSVVPVAIVAESAKRLQEKHSLELNASLNWVDVAVIHNQDLPVEDRIKVSFLDVLGRTDFNKIRMAEVAKIAGTSRQNIYRYFSSKEEIFQAAVDDLFDDFYEKATPFLMDAETDFSYFFIFLVYSEVQKHSDVFLSMMRSGADDILRQQMRRYYRRFVGKIIRAANIEVKEIDMLDYIGDIAVGSTFELLKRWVNTGMKESPQQMARIHSHFFNGKLIDIISMSASVDEPR